MPRTSLGLIASLSLLALTQPPNVRVAVAQSAPQPRIAKLTAALQSDDVGVADAAAAQLAKQPAVVSVPALDALLSSGQSDALTQRVLAVLAATRSDLALKALRSAMQHRLPAIRIAALAALSTFTGRDDVARHVALGLRDENPAVRAAAADGLAAMQARSEIGTLLLAFERGVPEAAVAIGQLANDATLPAFNAFLGRKPIAQMFTGYQAWLARSDVSSSTKLSIVATLENVAGLSVKRFLQTLNSSEPIVRDVALRRAIAATIARIPETPRDERSGT